MSETVDLLEIILPHRCLVCEQVDARNLNTDYGREYEQLYQADILVMNSKDIRNIDELLICPRCRYYFHRNCWKIEFKPLQKLANTCPDCNCHIPIKSGNSLAWGLEATLMRIVLSISSMLGLTASIAISAMAFSATPVYRDLARKYNLPVPAVSLNKFVETVASFLKKDTPRPGQGSSGTYPFNEGQSYLRQGQNLDSQVYLFKGSEVVPAKTFLQEENQAAELGQAKLVIFEADLNGDKKKEAIVFPNRPMTVGDYIPTIQSPSGKGYKVMSRSHLASGKKDESGPDRYLLQDIRDVNGDGRLDVIIQASSGNGSSNIHTEVIWFDGQAYRSQIFNNFTKLKNFEKDKTFELVVTSIVNSHENFSVSSANQAFWSDVYHWQGKYFAQSNKKYPTFFSQEVIPQYNKEIQELRSQNDPDLAVASQIRQKLMAKAKSLVN